MRYVGFLVLATLCLLSLSPVLRALPQPAGRNEVEVTEHLGGTIPGNLQFLDEDSTLVAPFRNSGIPILVTMMVFNCPDNCNALPEGVADLINLSDLIPGKDYKALTISLHPEEMPVDAKAKKDSMQKILRKEITGEAWQFLCGTDGSQATLASALGIEYIVDGNKYFYPHLAVLISREGKIVKYLYGQLFNLAEFRMAVENARDEKVSPTFVKRLHYCLSYDPDVYPRYRFILHIMMVLILLALGVFATILFRRFSNR